MYIYKGTPRVTSIRRRDKQISLLRINQLIHGQTKPEPLGNKRWLFQCPTNMYLVQSSTIYRVSTARTVTMVARP